MAIAYENGVNLFDTAEVYASGRSAFTSSSKHKTFASVFLLVDFFIATSLLPINDIVVLRFL